MVRNAAAAGVVSAALVLSGGLTALPAEAAISGWSGVAAAGALARASGGITAAAATSPDNQMTSVGIGEDPLAGLPTHGTSFVVLSTGHAADAELPNTTSRSTQLGWDEHANPWPWPPGEGPTSVRDLTTLQVTFDVPSGGGCVSFDFKMLTEELGGEMASARDGFVAVLDGASNIALDPDGFPLSVPTAERPSAWFTSEQAAGTTYNAATPTFTATAPVDEGSHTVRFAIYDATDALVDSAVFIDDLTVGPAPSCAAALPVTVAGASTMTVDSASQFSSSIVNPTSADLELDQVTVQLPRGVAYVPGSTGGMTTGDPVEEDGLLTWTTEQSLASEEVVSLTFSLVATRAGAAELELVAAAGEHRGRAVHAAEVVKRTTRTTVKATRSANRLAITGAVKGGVDRGRVEVTLLREKGGRFRTLERARDRLDPQGRFKLDLPRASRGQCRVVASFPGDAGHEPSSARIDLRC